MDRLQPAYILLRRPYSNSSLLLEIFTPEYGRVAAIAKGARGKAGKYGGHLQPFIPLEVSWGGRGEVKTLMKAEARGRCHITRGRQLYCGFYLNELLTRLLQREDPHTELFAHYAATLDTLANDNWPEKLEPLLRRFEVALLESAGFGMQLKETAEGEPVKEDRSYHYLVEHGPVGMGADNAFGCRGETLLALAGARSFTDVSIKESRRLMRQVMSYYLGDKPLKSRELFRSLFGGK